MFDVISTSSRPVLVVRLPDEEILLATPSALALLAPGETDIRGRALTDFTSPADHDSAELMAKGHLNGLQTRRMLQRDPAVELELWFRTVVDGDADSPVLVLLSESGAAPTVEDGEPPTPAIIGSVERQLAVDRVSAEVEQVMGLAPEELLGRSILGLISPDDLPALLFGLAQATASQSGVSLAMKLVRPDHIRVRCQLVLLPLSPTPSFAFAIQPAQEFVSDRRTPADFRELLRRFGQGIASAAAARELTAYRSGLRPALPELTSREMQIVSRLVAGDRVPAISKQLYLAQSTVRNHLSAVFAKLGVKSQQELIVLLRQTQSRRDQLS